MNVTTAARILFMHALYSGILYIHRLLVYSFMRNTLVTVRDSIFKKNK